MRKVNWYYRKLMAVNSPIEYHKIWGSAKESLSTQLYIKLINRVYERV